MFTGQTRDRNAVRLVPTAGDLYDPETAAQLLTDLHAKNEPFVLEAVGRAADIQHIVRTHEGKDGVASCLRRAFIPSTRPPQDDFMLMSRRDHRVVWSLVSRRISLLPTAVYTKREAEVHAAVMLGHIRARAEKGVNLALRIMLTPASEKWRRDFNKTLQRRPSGALDALVRDRDGQAPEVEKIRELISERAHGPAFHVEVQVVVTSDGTLEKRGLQDELEKFRRLVLNLTGGADSLKRDATKKIDGDRLLRDSQCSSLPGWDLHSPLSPRRFTRFAMSIREVAPLWLAPLAIPQAVEAEDLLRSVSVQVEPSAPVAPVAQEADGASADAAGETATAANQLSISMTDNPRPPGRRWGEEGPYSAQPEGLFVAQMSDLSDSGRRAKRHREGSFGYGSAEDVDRAQSIARAWGVTAQQAAFICLLADAPLATHRFLGANYGCGDTTSKDVIETLKERDLVHSRRGCVGRSERELLWIPDHVWEPLGQEWIPPLGAPAVQRRLLNLEFTDAVYRVTGVLVNAETERRLVRLHWSWKRPFDALLRFTDGWAALFWSGIWHTQEKLERRLQEFEDEIGEWSAGQGTHWPGRLAFVVPDCWQAEIVWRAVRRRGWEASTAVYNLGRGDLTGDLDLRTSRGTVPPQISDELSLLRVDVDAWVDLLSDDPGGRMRRLIAVIEEHPGILASHLGQLAAINGSSVKAGVEELCHRGVICQAERGGYALIPRALAMAARRDRTWLGLPARRSGAAKLAQYSDQKSKRNTAVQRLLAKFAVAGCSVAGGWRGQDGKFQPAAIVWLRDGPYGPGWHYLVDATHAKAERTVGLIVHGLLSDTRSDRYPALVVCREEIEPLFWSLGQGAEMLTAAVERIRSGPVVGPESAAWMQFGDPVSISPDFTD